MIDSDHNQNFNASAAADPRAEAQMPRYKCHKEVWALKIKSVETEKLPSFKGLTCRGSFVLGSACGHCERCQWERDHGPQLGATIVPEENGYASFTVSRDYLAKHRPEPGGYYVVYDDGYKSFSPAKAFEDGYSLV